MVITFKTQAVYIDVALSAGMEINSFLISINFFNSKDEYFWNSRRY